eukprot:COSAG03_NODE_1137_length_4741_cov_33.999138_2_plen_114_part_00
MRCRARGADAATAATRWTAVGGVRVERASKNWDLPHIVERETERERGERDRQRQRDRETDRDRETEKGAKISLGKSGIARVSMRCKPSARWAVEFSPGRAAGHTQALAAAGSP